MVRQALDKLQGLEVKFGNHQTALESLEATAVYTQYTRVCTHWSFAHPDPRIRY